jgi:hypothetical protein
MASLKLLLGMIPSTAKIEQAEKALTMEFTKLQSFAGSDTLARYNELNQLVNSSGFTQKKKEIESLTYKNSEEYTKEKEFLSMQKSKDILLYFKTLSGNKLRRFREMDASQKITEYETLEKFIQSSEFKEKQKVRPFTFKDTDEFRKMIEHKALRKDPEIKAFLKKGLREGESKSRTILRFEELDIFINSSEFRQKKKMRPITFKDSEEYKQLLEYNRLKKNLEIKEYYIFKSSKEYKNFLNIDGSMRLARYHELKDYIATPEFKDKKNYLLDKKRFEKTEMSDQIKEYEKLKKSDDIIWYFKVKDSTKFDLIKSRELTFSDEFESDRLDTARWITNYYWGEKLLKDRYSVSTDMQAYTEKENFEIRNSVLKIVTKPQKITGKEWSPAFGFKVREFNYSSGIINSGGSFRQKYGIFSAKIKLGNPTAKNSFWMLGDKITPHIDVCRTSAGKVMLDIFSNGDKPMKTSIGSKYANDFFIYTLEWTPDKLVWKINDTVAFIQTSNVPQEPLFINFSGGLDKPISGMTSMEIDWVRVYKTK